MIGPILEYEDLRRLSRLGDKAQLATIERWAQRINLKYQYDGRGGIWTTVRAMDAAVGLASSDAADAQLYSADMA